MNVDWVASLSTGISVEVVLGTRVRKVDGVPVTTGVKEEEVGPESAVPAYGGSTAS